MPAIVAIVLPNLGGGGAERVALATAKDLVARGHTVDLVLVEATGELLPLVPKGVRVVDLDSHRMIAALPPLLRYFRERRPDAVHAMMWPLTVIVIMAHRLARSPARVVVSDHTNYARHLEDPRQLRAIRWTTRFLYPSADARIACSAAAADVLARLSHIERSRFEVINSPIAPPARIARRGDVQALWLGASRRIINIGSLNPVKNQALLIRAFARLDDKGARLVILGEGPERPRLEALASRLGVSKRVVMPGFVTDPWPYLGSAELFVLSSNYEGSPVALAEAMYAGLNVVSTDCPSGPAELLDGGRYGRLVPCNDEEALAEAIRDALAAARDPASMRRRAEQVAGAASIDRYREATLG
jgi:glycosyltransferase involved in cell wall biosynthesis